jgi:hypothetical protein
MDVSSTTKSYYDKAIQRIRKAVAPDSTGLDFLATPAPVVAWIEDQASNNSRKTYYSVVKSVLAGRKQDSDAEALATYGKYFTVYFKRLRDAAMKQEPMDKEGDDPLVWDEVIKARDKLIAEKDWQNACLLGCYTYIPPRRCDYGNMLVVRHIHNTRNDELYNFCLLRKGKGKSVFIFNKFKTEKTFGQQIVPIPKPLAALIWEWINSRTDVKMNQLYSPLFIKGSGDAMDAHRLSQHLIDLIERTTGKKAGASLLRHAFLTDLLKDEKSLAEKKPIADLMAHSTHTQELYARK